MSVGRELGRREHEHARDVERDVAVADHDRALGREQVELEVGVVGVAVVPADELGRGMRAGQIFAGDPERPVRRRAGRVDDRVVVLAQILARDVLAEGDVAEVAKARDCAAVFSYTRVTDLIFGWSGATPERTRPHGVGSRSIMSTSRRPSAAFSRCPAA